MIKIEYHYLQKQIDILEKERCKIRLMFTRPKAYLYPNNRVELFEEWTSDQAQKTDKNMSKMIDHIRKNMLKYLKDEKRIYERYYLGKFPSDRHE